MLVFIGIIGCETAKGQIVKTPADVMKLKDV